MKNYLKKCHANVKKIKMPDNNKTKCMYCNKAIRKYKTWDDWDKRKSHYSCWKRAEEQYRLDEHCKEFLLTQPKQVMPTKDF